MDNNQCKPPSKVERGLDMPLLEDPPEPVPIRTIYAPKQYERAPMPVKVPIPVRVKVPAPVAVPVPAPIETIHLSMDSDHDQAPKEPKKGEEPQRMEEPQQMEAPKHIEEPQKIEEPKEPEEPKVPEEPKEPEQSEDPEVVPIQPDEMQSDDDVPAAEPEVAQPPAAQPLRVSQRRRFSVLPPPSETMVLHFPHPCPMPDCNRTFRTFNGTKQHMLKTHKVSSRVLRQLKNEHDDHFVCRVCRKSYKTQRGLQTHMKTHNEIIEFHEQDEEAVVQRPRANKRRSKPPADSPAPKKKTR